MSNELPVIYLARHGETAWSLTGQHTGLTDLPLTERGEQNARALGERLIGLTFAKVFTSPLQRAARTCELAGPNQRAASTRRKWPLEKNSTSARTARTLLSRQSDRVPTWSGDSPPGQPSRNSCQSGRSVWISAVRRPSYWP
jgi:bisphosphoglycerate-dependent phosphoglycerate mutase